MKEFADDNFKFDENGRKLSKWVEKTAGKGEILLRAISPFPTVFKRLVSQGRQKVSLYGNGLKSSFIDDGKRIRQKVHFLDVKWD